jgi:hypothetical protein
MRFWLALVSMLALLASGSLHPSRSSAETPVESLVETRLMVGVRAPAEGLRPWLPGPWEAAPPAAGPLAGTSVYAAAEPTFFRIYRVEWLTDLRSASSGSPRTSATCSCPDTGG